jgi:hypothetical protein
MSIFDVRTKILDILNGKKFEVIFLYMQKQIFMCKVSHVNFSEHTKIRSLCVKFSMSIFYDRNLHGSNFCDSKFCSLELVCPYFVSNTL